MKRSADDGWKGVQTVPEKQMHRATFFLDTVLANKVCYEGWTDDSDWNGWATPWFEQAVAEQILSDVQERERPNNRESFRGYSMNGVGYALYPDEIFMEQDLFCDDFISRRLYPIGTNAWCWVDKSRILRESKREGEPR